MARPFIPATDCTRIELIYTLGSLVAENVFYWRSPHPLSAAELAQVGAAVKTEWNTCIRPQTSMRWSLTTIKLTGMNTDHEPVLSYTTGLPLAGSLSAEAPSPHVTFCISCRTGFAGRSYRGRWYWIGMADGYAQNAGVVTSGYAEALRNALATFQYNLTWGSNPVDGNHVICSFRRNKDWRSVAEVNDVTAYTVTDLNVDSMRRRLPGRGRT